MLPVFIVLHLSVLFQCVEESQAVCLSDCLPLSFTLRFLFNFCPLPPLRLITFGFPVYISLLFLRGRRLLLLLLPSSSSSFNPSEIFSQTITALLANVIIFLSLSDNVLSLVQHGCIDFGSWLPAAIVVFQFQ